MDRRTLLGLMGAMAATPAAAQETAPKAGQGWWTFDPPADDFDPTSQLDLRSLNETTAGEHGFIKVGPDGSGFARGDGEPIRFWGGTVHGDGDRARLDHHARFLAKRGVNMVRWHGNLAPTDRDESQLSDVNEPSLDQAFYLIAAMKKQGIYTTVSPYWAFFEHLRQDGKRRFPNWPVPRDPAADTTAALLFFDPVMIEAYKVWIRELFTRINPYTGLALKDEPALAIFQIQNEDSLLFWTLNNLKGADRALLEQQFGNWQAAFYGKAGDTTIPNLYDLTQPPPADPERARHLADVTRFLTETMRDFNGEIVAWLRDDLGAKCLVNPGNWRTASTFYLNDAERYSYAVGDVMAVNRYVTGRHEGSDTTGWAVKAGDHYTDVSTLTEVSAFPLAVKQAEGYPMLVTESLWVPPTAYESEGPFLVSAMQSLTGVAGYYWFSLGDAGAWGQPHSANGFLPSISKWSANSPMILGQFPAAALMYRLGYVEPADEPVVVEHRPPGDLWQRKAPRIAEESGFDPNRDTVRAEPAPNGDIPPLAFLAGKVAVSYDQGADHVADLSQHIDAAKRTVTDLTGALTWNYGDGIARLDTPKAQGVTGFLCKGGGHYRLSDCDIVSTDDYATVLVISLDSAPLRDSRKVLVQIGTRARPSGWIDRPATWTGDDGKAVTGHEIVSHGQAPWLIADSHVELRIDNSGLSKAITLDANGSILATSELHRDGTTRTFTVPANGLHFILEA